MNTLKKFFALAAMSILPIWTMAQEVTREISSHPDEFSIVRETPDGRWLVYNFTSGLSYFSLVSDTASMAEMLQLGYNAGSNYTRLRDFEIFNDTVFFCGQTGTKDTPKSIWGYFPLAGFPSVNVFVHENNFDYLKKLEVFSVDPTMNEIHVVMLGHKGGMDMVVDEMRVAPNQFIETRSEIFDPPMRFNDIAVTDSHIVVAAEPLTGVLANSKKTVFIERPLSTGTYILGCNTYYRDRLSSYNPVLGNELLVSCEREFCVLACIGGLPNSIVVTAYQGKNVYNTLYIPLSSVMPASLVSMCYGKRWRNLELLTQTLGNTQSNIYSLYPALAFYGGMVYQHIYHDENLASLDWLSTDDECVVASGHDDATSTLRVYRYNHSMWKPCTERDNTECYLASEDKGPESVKPVYEVEEVTLVPLESFESEKPMETICK